jgi:hypothetical protein
MYCMNADCLHLSLILSSLLNHVQYEDTNADAADRVILYINIPGLGWQLPRALQSR